MTREVLPPRRSCFTFTLRWKNSVDFAVTYGVYDAPGASPPLHVGEVFVSGVKTGVELESVLRDAAILASFALQHGCPLDTIRYALSREGDGSPQSIIGIVLDRVAQEAQK